MTAPRLRLLLWALVAASWLVLLPMLWSAFATVPSAERLAVSHTAEIPTLATLGWMIVRSGLEAGVVLALLWPWRARLYLARLTAAGVAALVWFFASTPLSLTRLSWVHRRWLGLLALGLLAAAVLASLGTLVRHARGQRTVG